MTWIPESWRRPIDALERWSVRNAKAIVYERLSALEGTIAIGALDVSLEIPMTAQPFWAPHVHLVIGGASKAAIQAAFDSPRRIPGIRAPLDVRRVEHLPNVLSYALKVPGVRRVAYERDEKTWHRKVSLRTREHQILEHALSPLGQLELIITHGAGFPAWARV